MHANRQEFRLLFLDVLQRRLQYLACLFVSELTFDLLEELSEESESLHSGETVLVNLVSGVGRHTLKKVWPTSSRHFHASDRCQSLPRILDILSARTSQHLKECLLDQVADLRRDETPRILLKISKGLFCTYRSQNGIFQDDRAHLSGPFGCWIFNRADLFDKRLDEFYLERERKLLLILSNPYRIRLLMLFDLVLGSGPMSTFYEKVSQGGLLTV